MSLPIDSSRALRTPDELRALVRAIRDAPASEPETDSVEWKSEWSLEDTNKCFATAKHILGFGNRSIAAASNAFDGCAYFLAGVEPGNLCGTAPLDPAKISDKLGRYVEGGAPRWSPHYVETDDKSVLVLLAEGPKLGDPICTLQKSFEGFFLGSIFIRKHGKTEAAGPADIRALEARIKASRPRVELSVGRIGEKRLPVISLPPEVAKVWLEGEETRLQLPPPPAPEPRGIFDLPRLAIGPDGDPRSRSEYATEVSAYLDKAGRRWKAGMLKSAIEQGVAAFPLQIENSTDRNYPAVEVVLKVPAGAIVWHEADEVDADLALPIPPKPWGTKRMLEITQPDLSHLGFHRPVALERGEDSTVVRFEPIHVRPLDSVPLPSLHLILMEHVPEFEVGWRLTSSAVDGQISGSVTCVVEDLPVIPRFGGTGGR